MLELASSNRMLLTCGDVDALWRTAEALARTGDESRALDAYRYVLANCPQANLRLSTVQKADQVLSSPEAVDGLMQMGKRQPDGHGEFEQVRLDRVRRKIGNSISAPSGEQPSPADIEAVAARAVAPDGHADADLLGWYAYGHKDFTGAQNWFGIALKAGTDPKAAEGLVLAVRESGDLDQARKLAISYAGVGEGNRKVMVDALSEALTDPKAKAPTEAELSTLTQAVNAGKSADGAQALGWHYYKAKDFAAADGWFHKSADWTANESAAIGLVVTARHLHHDRDYAALITTYAKSYPKIAELEAIMRSRPSVSAVYTRNGSQGVRVAASYTGHHGAHPANPSETWDASADQVVKTFEAGQYDSALALLDQRRQKRSEPHGLSVVRGWALYHKGDWESAKQAFSSLDGGTYSREQQEGLRVIQAGYTNPRYR